MKLVYRCLLVKPIKLFTPQIRTSGLFDQI